MINPETWNRLFCPGCLRYIPSDPDGTLFWHQAPGLGTVIAESGCPGSSKPGFPTMEEAAKNRLSTNPFDYRK